MIALPLADVATWADRAQTWIVEQPAAAPLAVFVGGLLTAANPCVLASIPLVMSFVSGQQRVDGVRRGLVLSGFFVLGLSVVFVILGLIAALAGTLLGDVGAFWDWVVLIVCLLMGAHLTGLLEIPMPNVTVKPRWRGVPGALLLGALFGVVSSPCATPILVVVLAYVAGTGASLPYGALLLLAYALGHSMLILLAGASAGAAKTLVESRGLQRTAAALRVVAGIAIAAVGIWVFLT